MKKNFWWYHRLMNLFHFVEGGGGKDAAHQRAGAPGADPGTTAGLKGLRRGQPPPAKGSRFAATSEAVDGSDLDISDSLPHDSPVLSGPAGRPPPVPASPPHQPVYASVVKKKKKPSPPRVEPTTATQFEPIAGHNKTMTDAPRSPAKIPLIRISQTESVERAERNPPTPIADPPVEHQVRLLKIELIIYLPWNFISCSFVCRH